MRPRIPRRTSPAIALAVALIAGTSAHADPAAEPAASAVAPGAPLDDLPGLLPIRPQLPAKLPFLFPALGGGSIPAPYESRFTAGLLYTSTLQYTRGVIASERPDPTLGEVVAYMDAVHDALGKTLFYYDGETVRLDLGWTLGLPGAWEVGVDVPVIRHAGGWADETISRFHSGVGVSDAGRDSAPSEAGAAIFLSTDGSYELTGDDLPGAVLGDVALRGRVRLPLPGPAWAADLTVAVELPTGDTEQLAGSGEVDASLGFTVAWRHLRSRWTFAAGYSHLGGLGSLPEVEISDVWTATAAYEVRMSPRTAFLAQILHGTSPFYSLRKDGISDPAGLLGLGLRFAAGAEWGIDVGMVEDLYRHNTDLDIGLLVLATWTP